MALSNPEVEFRMNEADSLQKGTLGPQESVTKFRLLIIGKSGCGKTTILSKVCGEEVADRPSTTRGTHNIERELQFKDNEQFIVHDSEGFEAGQDDEFNVVTNFINSRGRTRPINERLHAIWYCLATKSRPIQQAEEIFFSEKHDVPVVAIFTKFDLFIESHLQVLMEDVDPDDLDEEKESELEKDAENVAMKKFEEHFKGALLKRAYPPHAVVALSDVHSSTPTDPRLGELIRATSTALRIDSKGGSKEEQRQALRLAALFAAAQQADLEHKFKWSIRQGTPYLLEEQDARAKADLWRPDVIDQWSEKWVKNQALLSEFAKHLEEHPETFGTKKSPTYREGKELGSKELEAYRCLQLAAHLTAIMTQVFLLKVEDEGELLSIVRSEEEVGFKLFMSDMREPVGLMIDTAVRTLLDNQTPVPALAEEQTPAPALSEEQTPEPTLSEEQTPVTSEEQTVDHRLVASFAAAEQGNLNDKYVFSIRQGTPYLLEEQDAREKADVWRPNIIELWSQKWMKNEALMAEFTKNLEKHPETFGTKQSPTYREGKELTSKELEAYRCLQLAAHLTAIMAQVFLLNVEDEGELLGIVQKYISTSAFTYIQNHILDVDVWTVYSEEEKGFKLFMGEMRDLVGPIIGAAVRTLLEPQIPVPTRVDEQTAAPTLLDEQTAVPTLLDEQTAVPTLLDEQIPAPALLEERTPAPALLEDQTQDHHLAALRAAVGQADLNEKYTYSIRQGTPYLLEEQDAREKADLWRPNIIELWSEKWAKNEALMAEFAKNLEENPEIFGTKKLATYREGKELTSKELEAYRCLQLAAHLTAIMAEIFLLKIEDEVEMLGIVRRYTSTSVFVYIQEHILDLDVWSVYIEEEKGFKLFMSDMREPLGLIIDRAIHTLLEPQIPVPTLVEERTPPPAPFVEQISLPTLVEDQAQTHRLTTLFAAAEQTELNHKYAWSIRQGTPYVIQEHDAREKADQSRPDVIDQWSEKWVKNEALLSQFTKSLEEHPETFGTKKLPTYRQGKELTNKELEAYRCLQLAAHLTAIMAQIFLLKIEDEEEMLGIVRKYPSTSAFAYIQDHILDVDVWTVYNEEEKGFKLFMSDMRDPLGLIIGAAVRTLLEK